MTPVYLTLARPAALPAQPQICTVEIGKHWDGQHVVHRDGGVYWERGMRDQHMSREEVILQRALIDQGAK